MVLGKKVFLERGLKPGDLEKGIEFQIDHEENLSSSDEDFGDEQFENYKISESDVSKDLLLLFSELKKLMTPVTEDGHVMKQILRRGAGVVIPDKSVVIMHYDALLDNQKNPFDSTRLRNRPYKFLLGDGSVIPGLDFAVQTMKKDEISKFLVSSQYAFGEMGCPPRIPGGAQILYIVEVLNFYDSKDAIEFEEMTPEEQKKASFDKVIAVYRCELKMGNELLENKQYKPAIARYRRIVKLLEDVSVSNEVEDEKRKEYLLKVYLNLSLGYASIKNSSKAIMYADLCLKLDEYNPKAMYRMGYALFLAGEFGRAKYFLNKAKQCKPFDKSINQLLMDLEHKQKQHKQWENICYKKMFPNNKVETKTVPQPPESKEFKNVLERRFKMFVDSTEKELRFTPGYNDDQIDIVKDLAREYKLAFVNKIQNGTKILKVAKKLSVTLDKYH